MNITVSVYFPAHSRYSHQPSGPPLPPLTICCWHRDCYLHAEERFLSGPSPRLIPPEILQTSPCWHKSKPHSFQFFLSSVSQLRYIFTKKTNQIKPLKCYSSLPERKKVEPDADLHVSTAYVWYLLSLMFVNGYKMIKCLRAEQNTAMLQTSKADQVGNRD